MIPVSLPCLGGNEWKYAKACLDSGQLSPGGAFGGRFEQAFAGYTGAKHALACISGSAALHLSLKLLGVQAGDYVLLPNLSAPAAAAAISHAGATPILIDASPQDWQLDLNLLEGFLGMSTLVDDKDDLILKRDGRRVRAILAVHFLGNMCDMERLLFIARRYHLEVLEDAGEALGSFFGGKHAGAFGRAGVFSFEPGKAITAGGGGMIIAGEEELAQRGRRLSGPPGEADQEEPAYDYRMPELLAAVGLAQMEQLPGFAERRKAIGAFYRERLSGVGDIRFQEAAGGAAPSNLPAAFLTARRRELQAYLKTHGIQSSSLPAPANQLPGYRAAIYIRREEQAARICGQGISIPGLPCLSEGQLEEVASRIATFFS